MSLAAMRRVWRNSQSAGSARLVLLTIADYAHDDPPVAWPSVATIMQRSGLGERTVQTALRALEHAAELKITARPGKPNVYTITIAADAPGRPLPVLDPDGLANRRGALRQSQFRHIADRDGWTCQVRGPRCTGHKYLTIGHRIPVANGGTDDDDNVQIECLTCNLGKGAR
jgi:hypothetical protein